MEVKDSATSSMKTSNIKDRNFFIYITIFISLLQISSFMYFFLLYDVFVTQLSSLSGGIFFMVLAVASYGLGYYLLTKYTKDIGKQGQQMSSHIPYLRLMFQALRIIFFVTAAILSIIIFQILTSSQYYVGLSLTIVFMSYLFAAVNLGLLGYKMLSWYKSRRNLTTLLFAITFLTAAIGFANIPIANTLYFSSANPYLTEKYYVDFGYRPDPESGEPVPHFSPKKSDSLFALYSLTTRILNIAYFPMWASAIVLVRDYARIIGKSKFLVITILPGVIFPIQIAESATGGIFPPLFASLYGASSLILSALFIGIIFFVTARNLRRIHGQSNPISHNLIITGFGFILGLIASSPAVHLIDKVHTPFPPFAVVPWAFVGFAAYLVSLGFFLSATTISQDAKLRKSVRQLATEESSKMLYSMGTAHMEQTIRTRVQSIAKEQEESLKKETGVQNVVSQEDVEAYVNDVIDELKKKRS